MDNLKKIILNLQETLENAPSENKCTDLENEMYADMQNLLESMQNLLESMQNLMKEV